MTWTTQASSSAVAAAALREIKYAFDNKVAGLACRHGEVVGQRAAVKVDMEGVPLPGAQSPTRPGMPSLGIRPRVQALIFNFLKIELKGRLLLVRAFSFLVQDCNSIHSCDSCSSCQRKLPLNQSNLQDLSMSLLYFLVALVCVKK